ncbi:MAG: beta-phosphoglucomutase, partial [Lactococcus sp.]
GVGSAEDLGTDIALVSNTNSLSLELLTKVWENK